VLYVGSSLSVRDHLESPLARAGLSCTIVETRTRALDALTRTTFAVCLIDLAADDQAIRLANAIAADHPETAVIAIADPDRPERTIEAIEAGFADVVVRPFGTRDIESIAAYAFDRDGASSRMPVDRTVRPFSVDLLGHSGPVRRLIQLIPRVARTRAPVLICAERGLDTEALARELHARSDRSAGPFEHVACAVEDPAALERDLFRTTVAPADLECASVTTPFAAARGGTLFVEDVGELSIPAQARLANLVRGDVEIERTPGAMRLDVRLIASAAHDIDRAVEDGHLHADLARQLGMVRLTLPPLRDRPEDIPLLCQYFTVERCADAGVGLKTFTQSALTVLSALPWSGNTAELRAVVEGLVRHVAAPVITLEDVLAQVKLDTMLGAQAASGETTLKEARLRFEREYIARVLDQHGWRMSDAARALGIQRTNLYRKTRQLQIPQERRRESAAMSGRANGTRGSRS
jgi:DNA-binding NtrC family response regulator